MNDIPRLLPWIGGVGAGGVGREDARYTTEELSQWKFTGMRL